MAEERSKPAAAMPEAAQALRERVATAIQEGRGCIVAAAPAIVRRGTYAGRDIIGPNSTYSTENVDDRGYVPVEWWIMSKTVALNPICREHEGVTLLALGTPSAEKGAAADAEDRGEAEDAPNAVRFNEAVDVAGDLLLGAYVRHWPLTKVLDIGGAPVKPRFIAGTDEEVVAVLEGSAAAAAAASATPSGGKGAQTEGPDSVEYDCTSQPEFPPIPCHVHCGDFGGSGSGKLEAYFFPPLDVPPYNLKVAGSVITRLGFKPSTTKDAVVGAMQRFGVDDSMYQLLQEYPVKARETWTIPTHVIHAPGPWTTFEIQLPQDDFNLFAWQLGQHIEDPKERTKVQDDNQLRGYKDERTLLDAALKWPLNVDPSFEEHWRNECEVIEEGSWGRRLRLFYHEFYGEGFEVAPGQTFRREAGEQPFAGITWSGHGLLNEVHSLSMEGPSGREFLVTPNTPIVLTNTGSIPLLVYCVFPFDLEAKLSTAEIGRMVQGHAGHGGNCGC